MDEIGAHNDNTFRVVYVGNLYSNIDLSEVKKAAQSFKEKNSNVQFVICGNGEYLPIFKNMSGFYKFRQPENKMLLNYIEN